MLRVVMVLLATCAVAFAHGNDRSMGTQVPPIVESIGVNASQVLRAARAQDTGFLSVAPGAGLLAPSGKCGECSPVVSAETPDDPYPPQHIDPGDSAIVGGWLGWTVTVDVADVPAGSGVGECFELPTTPPMCVPNPNKYCWSIVSLTISLPADVWVLDGHTGVAWQGGVTETSRLISGQCGTCNVWELTFWSQNDPQDTERLQVWACCESCPQEPIN